MWYTFFRVFPSRLGGDRTEFDQANQRDVDGRRGLDWMTSQSEARGRSWQLNCQLIVEVFCVVSRYGVQNYAILLYTC